MSRPVDVDMCNRFGILCGPDDDDVDDDNEDIRSISFSKRDNPEPSCSISGGRLSRGKFARHKTNQSKISFAFPALCFLNIIVSCFKMLPR